MNILCESSQELFQVQLKKLLENPEFKCSPRDLFIHEDLGFSARINNPRDRIIFSPGRKFDLVYALGETLWYLSGNDSLEMIQHYAPSYGRFSDDGKTLYGAYGPRLFGQDNGIQSVINKLKNDPDSRQAISIIWRAKDMSATTKDLPCTIAMQFFIRNKKLNLIVTMRSNDIWLGLPYDVFAFTIIQEYVSVSLGIDLGFYQHNVGSIHLYDKNLNKIKDQNYEEQYTVNDSISMDPLLTDDIKDLIDYEKNLRESSSLILPDKNKLKRTYYDLALVLLYGETKRMMQQEIIPEIFVDGYVTSAKSYIMSEIKSESIKRILK